MSIFIDDIKIIRIKKSGFIEKIKAELVITFFMVNIGPVRFYLSFKITQNSEKKIIKLSELAYIDKVHEKFHLSKANTIYSLIKDLVLLIPQK